MKFINEELPADSKTLIVGDGRSFYIKKKFVVSSVFDLSPIAEYAKCSKNGGEMHGKMKKDKITHILLNAGEARRLDRSYNIFTWDDKSLAVFNDFWNNHIKEVFEKKEVFLTEEISSNRGIISKSRITVYKVIDSAKERGGPIPYNYISKIIAK